MRADRMLIRPILPLLASLAAAVSGAGCTSSDGSSKSLTQIAGITTRLDPPKPFVQESRPADLPFLPVGVSVKRDAPRKTAAQFKDIETSLDAKRGSNEAAGAQAKVLGSTPPPAPPPVPK